MTAEVVVKKLETEREAEICARLMATSEPWITLRRDYQASLKTITAPKKEVYLATADSEIAGFIILNMHGALVGYIQSVCVAPGWRNNGIGTHLMQFAEDRIFRETPNVFICVSSFNPGAQRLYEKLGYRVVGALDDFVVSGHAEILLRKSIAPLAEFMSEVDDTAAAE